ncbi:MAG: hypothetical protein HFE72_03515 [Emergencia sp.]|nr:hypothetical protein [Emergencia sp.]
MKKVVMVMLIFVIFLLSSMACFAADPTEREDSTVEPMYVATQSHSETFTISSNGLAKMDVALAPFSSTILDRVNVTLSIKNSSGTSIYNKSYDMTWSSIYARFKLTKECQLSKSGTYEFQATYKCYKNNSLIETIKSSKILKSY